MEEMLRLLNLTNNEDELFEQLLEATNDGLDVVARKAAARIQAGRDIRFDLEKIIKENDSKANTSGVRPKKTGNVKTSPKIYA